MFTTEAQRAQRSAEEEERGPWMNTDGKGKQDACPSTELRACGKGRGRKKWSEKMELPGSGKSDRDGLSDGAFTAAVNEVCTAGRHMRLK